MMMMITIMKAFHFQGQFLSLPGSFSVFSFSFVSFSSAVSFLCILLFGFELLIALFCFFLRGFLSFAFAFPSDAFGSFDIILFISPRSLAAESNWLWDVGFWCRFEAYAGFKLHQNFEDIDLT